MSFLNGTILIKYEALTLFWINLSNNSGFNVRFYLENPKYFRTDQNQ